MEIKIALGKEVRPVWGGSQAALPALRALPWSPSPRHFVCIATGTRDKGQSVEPK